MKKIMWLSITCFLMATALFSQRQPPNTLTPQEKKQGWKLLFDGKTTQGWMSAKGTPFPDRGWGVKNGVLTVHAQQKGGDIITEESYSEFELSFEFKLTPGANSGVKYFVQQGTSLGLEYQLLDDSLHADAKEGVAGNRTLASLYDLIPAENKHPDPIGKWNVARIIVKGNHVEHWLNDEKVVEYDRGAQCFKALIAKSKFKDIENFGLHRRGHILLQDHGDTVSFRDIKIRDLESIKHKN